MTPTLIALKEANAAWSEALRAKAAPEVLERLEEARQAAATAHALWLAANI